MRNTLIHRMREELRLESQCKAKGCQLTPVLKYRAWRVTPPIST